MSNPHINIPHINVGQVISLVQSVAGIIPSVGPAYQAIVALVDAAKAVAHPTDVVTLDAGLAAIRATNLEAHNDIQNTQ